MKLVENWWETPYFQYSIILLVVVYVIYISSIDEVKIL